MASVASGVLIAARNFSPKKLARPLGLHEPAPPPIARLLLSMVGRFPRSRIRYPSSLLAQRTFAFSSETITSYVSSGINHLSGS
jgi:hypothetical protein